LRERREVFLLPDSSITRRLRAWLTVAAIEDTMKSGGISMKSGGISMAVDDETKKRVDRWIKEKKRNPYGDDQGTAYMGGTPLFDERTGRTKDKYDYILDKHPELRSK